MHHVHLHGELLAVDGVLRALAVVGAPVEVELEHDVLIGVEGAPRGLGWWDHGSRLLPAHDAVLLLVVLPDGEHGGVAVVGDLHSVDIIALIKKIKIH